MIRICIRVSAIGLLYLLAGSTCAQAAPAAYTPLHNSLMDQARTAIIARDYKKAEQLYTRAIEADFSDPSGWGARSVNRESLGNKEDAFRDNSTYIAAEYVLGLNDRDQDVFNLELASAYRRNAEYWYKKDDLLRAYVESSVAVRVDKTSGSGYWAEAWLAHADNLYALGDYDQAQTCLGFAQGILAATLHIDPKTVRSYTREGARQNALKHKPFQEMVDLRSQFSAAQRADESGDTKLAFSIYNAIIEIQPTNETGWIDRGILYAKNRLPGLAIDDFTTAIDLGAVKGFGSTHVALVDRAVVYNSEGKFMESYIDLQYAHKLKPDDKDIAAKLALVKSKIGSK